LDFFPSSISPSSEAQKKLSRNKEIRKSEASKEEIKEIKKIKRN